jgi:hypothetical protein
VPQETDGAVLRVCLLASLPLDQLRRLRSGCILGVLELTEHGLQWFSVRPLLIDSSACDHIALGNGRELNDVISPISSTGKPHD